MVIALMLVAAACSSTDSTDTTAAPTTTAAPAAEPTTTVAGATTTAPPDTTTTTELVFRDASILVVNNMAHLPVFVAQDLGLWVDRGLNVTVEILGSGADIAAGLEAGQAEFGAVNAGTGVAPQRASGLLTKLVAPYNSDATSARYVSWLGMVGRADMGITMDAQSIVGKKVAVTGGGTPRAYLRAWLDREGLTEDDIEIVTMGAPDMRTSILNGEVAVAVPWDPFYTSAIIELGDNAVLLSDGEPLVTSVIGLGAVDGQMEDDPAVFKAFIEGVVEAAFIIRSNPEAAAPLVINFIDGLSEEAAIAAMARSVYDPRTSICINWGVEDTSDQLVASGRIEGDFASTDLIDTSLLDEVLAENPQWIADLPPLPTDLADCTGYTG